MCNFCKAHASVAASGHVMAHDRDGKRCEGTGELATESFEAAPYKPVRVESEPQTAPPKRQTFPPLPTPKPVVYRDVRSPFYFESIWGMRPWEKEGITHSEWTARQRKEWQEKNAGTGYGDGYDRGIRTVSAGLPGLGRRR